MKYRHNKILFALCGCSLSLLAFLLFSYKSNIKEINIENHKNDDAEIIEIKSKNDILSESCTTIYNSITLDNTADDINTATSSKIKETTPNRVTYIEGFYYEPLSDEIISRIYGISYKEDCPVAYDDLRYLNVQYYNFSHEIENGELICNKAIAEDLVEIFYELYTNEYEIEKIKLIDEYNGDDILSMSDNNTSCFNYRTVDGTNKISKHGLGLAIDINPFYNPYLKKNRDGSPYISPSGSEKYADRTQDFPHKIDKNDLCYKIFTKHGFSWGGNWKSVKDYQHFFKEII